MCSYQLVVSKLNLVDLAGSERVGKTGSAGVILEEAKCTMLHRAHFLCVF